MKASFTHAEGNHQESSLYVSRASRLRYAPSQVVPDAKRARFLCRGARREAALRRVLSAIQTRAPRDTRSEIRQKASLRQGARLRPDRPIGHHHQSARTVAGMREPTDA